MNTKYSFLRIISFAVLLFTACAIPGLTYEPTLPPVVPSTTLSPQASPPVTNTDPIRPAEKIMIENPAPNIEVSSPVAVNGFSQPAFEQSLVVQITDESGSIIAEEYPNIRAEIGQAGIYIIEVAFNIPYSQPGRLSVFDISPRDGGILHLTSVPVILVPSLKTDPMPTKPQPEVILIEAPQFLAEVTGGEVQISGYSDYFFESNLGLAICGEGGSGEGHMLCGTQDNLLVEGFALIKSPDIGLPGPFYGTLDYTVTVSTRARVVVYAQSPRDGDLLHVSTQEITLLP
ncbi:MAG: Gmad2 immunoglobulin-like domain-containing protein [Chloroflexota bacterium]